MMHGDIEGLMVAPTAAIREAVERINAGRAGIALVVGPGRELVGTLTDGDIRRAVLAGMGLEEPVSRILDRKGGSLPVTAAEGTTRAELIEKMRECGVLQLPIVNSQGVVVDLALVKDFLHGGALPLQAVVMAGGFGKRLMPLTESTPKPMLPVGDKPLLEHIVGQLQASGIHRVKLTTHFNPETIRAHFGDGQEFGLDIGYVNEEEPLGTAGALGLIEGGDEEPVLLMNGDILTQVDFRALLAFHREHEAELTVGVRQYDFHVPYGVLQCEGERVLGIQEKPRFNFLVNAGIYLVGPSARRLIEPGRRFDMTQLIEAVAERGGRVVAFPIVEYWLDIGQLADYQKAQEDIRKWKD